ncbi:MAG: MFS transporter, partial [Mycobacteriaceae bacterium]|nr:MFS transporter [Mycobacteriaceae bacterium]
LIWISFLGSLGFVGMESVFALYGNHKFGFGLAQTGLIFMFIGVFAAIVQGGVAHRLTDRMGEWPVMRMGLWLTAASLILLGLVDQVWALLPVLALLALGSGLTFPTISALVSQRSPDAAQGGALGVLASAGGLARLIAPIGATGCRLPSVYKSKHLLPIVIIGIVVAALTAAQALLIDWLPPAATEQADRSFTLLWVLFWASAVFFVIVTAVLIYSIWKFRAKDDDLEDGPPIHGNTKLEVVWTVIPSLVLVFVAVYGYIVLDRNEAVAASNLKVDVYAQQFAWTYGYPDGKIQTGVLTIPVGQQTELHVRARDVIHDFWVPEFGIKGDAVPGIDHVLW